MTDRQAGPVVVVAGPTASGKSALALDAAEKFSGTIINADALQVYSDLEILSARPRGDELARVPHRLYGFLTAGEPCSAGRWLEMALDEIDAAHLDRRLPIVTGGTGLYIRALLQGLSAIPAIPDEIRAEARLRHQQIGPEAFHAELSARDPDMAARLLPSDRQRVIRAWEVHAATGRPLSSWIAEDSGAPPAHLRFLTLLVMPPREALFEACDARFQKMIEDGAMEEVRTLAAKDVAPAAALMKAVGVRPLVRHLEGDVSFEEACRLGARDTRRYAKRQVTWFRHQLQADHVLSAQYSESFKEKIFSFISDFLLTQTP